MTSEQPAPEFPVLGPGPHRDQSRSNGDSAGMCHAEIDKRAHVIVAPDKSHKIPSGEYFPDGSGRAPGVDVTISTKQ